MSSSMNESGDDTLRFIEKVEYRGHLIKIARHGDQIKLFIYPPNAVLATQRVVDRISNYEEALDDAKVRIDRLVRGQSD
jgi:hypothetical protein